MKLCIWCRKSEEETNFNKKAHTIPKSIGGKNICENVCDKCNSYFGEHHKKAPPIETVIKEAFNISRFRFLHANNDIGKNKTLPRFSSIYFKVNFSKHRISLKASYKFNAVFQEQIARQLKRGLYKILLEEIERQYNDGHNQKYDFIREFSRYNIGDYPVFYFNRVAPIIMSDDWVKSPEVFLKKEEQMKYIIQEPSFIEFEVLGHLFGFALSRTWELSYDMYKPKTIKAKSHAFNGFKLLKNFNDIDLTLSILD